MKWLIELHRPHGYYPFQFIPIDDSHLPHDDLKEIISLADQAEEWCQNQFGVRNRERWMMFSWGFLFRNSADAMAFKLRWL